MTALSGDRVLYYSASKGRGCIGSVDDDNNLADVRVYPEGSFAKDWTGISALNGDRVLYYSASKGPPCIGSVDGDNNLADVRVFPEDSFARDWTEISFMRPPESRVGIGRSARSRLA